MLSNDLLRTGAALVKALKLGDMTARFALSDFFAEHGMPNSSGRLANENVTERTRLFLLKELKSSSEAGVSVNFINALMWTEDDEAPAIPVQFAYCEWHVGNRKVWLGSWPMDVWLEEEPRS